MRKPHLVPRLALALAAVLWLDGCAVGRLFRYAIRPDAPQFSDGDQVMLAGLQAPVEVLQTPDGLWHVSATTELDGYRVLGYLMARDRAFQLDLLRHMAYGRLAELLGNRDLGGGKTILDADRFNRFMDFAAVGERLWQGTEETERAVIEAFVAGINSWIDVGHHSLEHRLLDVQMASWSVLDSLTIYSMFAFGLAGNFNRELRRLMLACAAGIDGMERIWPTLIDPDMGILPEADLDERRYPVPPAVVPELAAVLGDLCPQPEPAATADSVPQRSSKRGQRSPASTYTVATPLVTWMQGWPASNNWVVAGKYSASGKPILSNDPHLPLMNPPILWGYELTTPSYRIAGFTLAGLHRLFFGTNGHVAWGQTTNYIDRQDVYVLRPATTADGTTGYLYGGEVRSIETRVQTFGVRGDDPVTQTARFTHLGPILNDLDPMAAKYAPLSVLAWASPRGTDLNAARAMALARNVSEFAAAITSIDGDCSNWVIADTAGNIAYRSPCLLPSRKGWLGTFPVPGWDPAYAWGPPVDKTTMPQSTNAERGWYVSANSRNVPVDRYPMAYNSDPAPANRYQRISELLAAEIATAPLTPQRSARLQLDVGQQRWPQVRLALTTAVCNAGHEMEDAVLRAARTALCEWDGIADEDAVGQTLYVLTTHALLDAALADEIPGGAAAELWHYTQDLLQFEANVQRLWLEPATASVWDDVRTAKVEDRDAILAAAFATAVADARERWGDDLGDWRWSQVRKFRLRHPFAANDGLLAGLFNSVELPGTGGITTPYKWHHTRADRERMNAIVGPVVRLTYDMADPWAATYTFAGGSSGWPKAPHYADLVTDWRYGRERPLAAGADAVGVRITFR